MRSDIIDEIDKCSTCQANRRVNTRSKYHEMPTPTYPSQIIGTDLIGPLPRSGNGNVYVLTIIDHFSA